MLKIFKWTYRDLYSGNIIIRNYIANSSEEVMESELYKSDLKEFGRMDVTEPKEISNEDILNALRIYPQDTNYEIEFNYSITEK